jgi:diketogulonate reductase-like aldo/keto reductase
VRSDSKFLNERAFAIIDALREIAAARGATPSQVALRWVMDRAGVASTIIGARTLAQLDDNLGAASIRLAPDDTRRLDEVSRVELPFPCDFLELVRPGIQNGTTVNGQPSDPWHLSPKTDAERW